MKLVSKSFMEGDHIPPQFAFADIDLAAHFSLSSNNNPHLEWSEVPPQTKSFALICHDEDVPTNPEDVNREGREVSESLPRKDFFHWILLDIPPEMHEIAAGSFSDCVTPRGKAGPSTSSGLRQGLNDYTSWFANDPQMAGRYFGYDGPAPPWNDRLLHHYRFTLFALDVSHLDIRGDITGLNVRDALSGHVIAIASLMGTYSLNPEVRQRGQHHED
jgi:Raf kinase inhibitor-like YbhB/YbcL family protein